MVDAPPLVVVEFAEIEQLSAYTESELTAAFDGVHGVYTTERGTFGEFFHCKRARNGAILTMWVGPGDAIDMGQIGSLVKVNILPPARLLVPDYALDSLGLVELAVACPLCRTETSVADLDKAKRVTGLTDHCKVCLDVSKPAEVYFASCGHVPCCSECLDRLKPTLSTDEYGADDILVYDPSPGQASVLS